MCVWHNSCPKIHFVHHSLSFSVLNLFFFSSHIHTNNNFIIHHWKSLKNIASHVFVNGLLPLWKRKHFKKKKKMFFWQNFFFHLYFWVLCELRQNAIVLGSRVVGHANIIALMISHFLLFPSWQHYNAVAINCRRDLKKMIKKCVVPQCVFIRFESDTQKGMVCWIQLTSFIIDGAQNVEKKSARRLKNPNPAWICMCE